MNLSNTINKPRILFANFERLEKNLFFQIDYTSDFEVVGIVSEFTAEEIIYFLKYDSNHGKSVSDQFVIVNDKKEGTKIIYKGFSKANIKVINPSDLKKSLINKLDIDIIIDLSDDKIYSDLIKLSKLGGKAVVALANNLNKKDKTAEVFCFGINHQNIDISKNTIILIPKIESSIIKLINKNFEKTIDFIDFNIIKGASSNMNLVDKILDSDSTPFEFKRSINNNIIPSENNVSKILENLDYLNDDKDTTKIFGSSFFVPVTTGSLINISLVIEKKILITDVIKSIKKFSNNLIGFSEDALVAQDIVSTDFFGVIDKNLLKCCNNKTKTIIKMGVWFDFETSFNISVLKIIQYIVGTAEFNKQNYD